MARGRGETSRVHRARDQRPRHGVRHGARDLPNRHSKLNAGAFILEIARSEIAYTDQRPAEYVAVMLAAALARGVPRPGVHSGRSLPGQREEVRGRSRDRSGCGEGARARSDRRGLLQHRHRYVDARRHPQADARRTAAAQLRSRDRHSPNGSRARAQGRDDLRRWRDRRSGHAKQHGRRAARVHGRLQSQPAGRNDRDCRRSACSRARRTAAWCLPTARSPT